MKVFVLAVALACAAPGLAAAQGCERCDQRLDLSADEWNCLLARLPEIQRGTTPVVFFSLSRQMCSGPSSRNTEIPEASTEASRVYRITQDQLRCLAAKAPSKPRGGRVVFHFPTECGFGPAAYQPSPYAAPLPPTQLTSAPVSGPRSPYELYQGRREAPAQYDPPPRERPRQIAQAPAPDESEDQPPVDPYAAYRAMVGPNR